MSLKKKNMNIIELKILDYIYGDIWFYINLGSKVEVYRKV